MQVTNNTPEDITFELDVNRIPVKGMQSRITIRAQNYGEIDVEHVRALVEDKNFQAQIAAGNITLVKPYTAWGGGTGLAPVAPAIIPQARVYPVTLPTDAAYIAAILAFINGTL